MNNLRNIAALLLVLEGIINISLFFEAEQAPETVPVLVFGIIFAIVGTLLGQNSKFAVVLGIVVPLFGIAAMLFLTGLTHWSFILSGLMITIDLTVVTLCIIMLLKRMYGTD